MLHFLYLILFVSKILSSIFIAVVLVTLTTITVRVVTNLLDTVTATFDKLYCACVADV